MVFDVATPPYILSCSFSKYHLAKGTTCVPTFHMVVKLRLMPSEDIVLVRLVICRTQLNDESDFLLQNFNK